MMDREDVTDLLDCQSKVNEAQAGAIESIAEMVAELARELNDARFRIEELERAMDRRGGLGSK